MRDDAVSDGRKMISHRFEVSGQGSDLYRIWLDHHDHAKLAKYRRTKKRLSWVLTYDNVPRKLYADLGMQSFSLSNSAYEHRNGKELLIHPDSVTISSESLSAIPTVIAV